MINIKYNLANFDEALKGIAKYLQTKVTASTLAVEEPLGTGFIRTIDLPNGLRLLVLNFIPFEDIRFHHSISPKDFFVLRIDEVTGADGVARGSVFLGKTTNEWVYLASSNKRIRQVNILIRKEWFSEYFFNEDNGELLINFLMLNQSLHLSDLLDAEYRITAAELFDNRPDKRFEKVIIQNRAALIMERFFGRLYHKLEQENKNQRISAAEMMRLKEVNMELLKDFSMRPPGIVVLARMAAMSPSKFKSLFKEVYGMPVNQYFQNQRMKKSKAMLLSKKYSLKNIAASLGFASVGEFSKSFFKVFDETPVESTVNEKEDQ